LDAGRGSILDAGLHLHEVRVVQQPIEHCGGERLDYTREGLIG
jgi:hypothetical protein